LNGSLPESALAFLSKHCLRVEAKPANARRAILGCALVSALLAAVLAEYHLEALIVHFFVG